MVDAAVLITGMSLEQPSKKVKGFDGEEPQEVFGQVLINLLTNITLPLDLSGSSPGKEGTAVMSQPAAEIFQHQNLLIEDSGQDLYMISKPPEVMENKGPKSISDTKKILMDSRGVLITPEVDQVMMERTEHMRASDVSQVMKGEFLSGIQPEESKLPLRSSLDLLESWDSVELKILNPTMSDAEVIGKIPVNPQDIPEGTGLMKYSSSLTAESHELSLTSEGYKASLTAESHETESNVIKSNRTKDVFRGTKAFNHLGEPGSELPGTKEIPENAKNIEGLTHISPGGSNQREEDSFGLRESFKAVTSKDTGAARGKGEGILETLNSLSFKSPEFDLATIRPGELARENIFSRIIPSIVEEVQVIRGLGKGDGEIRVRLQPESLGEVVIRLSKEDGRITGRIFAENPLVRELVEANLSQLRQRLSEQNINLGELNVFLGSEDQGKGKEGQAWFSEREGRLNSVSRRNNRPSTEAVAPVGSSERCLGRLNILA